MTRTAINVLLCAALCAPAAAAQQPAPAAPSAQQPAAAAKPDAPRPPAVDLSEDFVRVFPDRTLQYVEIQNLGSLVDQLGGTDTLLESLNTYLDDAVPKTSKPLTSKELDTILDATVAIGVLAPPPKKPGASAGFENGAPVAVVHTTQEGAALLRDRLILPFVTKNGAKPTAETVHGIEVMQGAGGYAYAIQGRSVVVGSPETIRLLLDAAASDGPRLGDEPGYNSALAKHASGSGQVFAFTNARMLKGLTSFMYGPGDMLEEDGAKQDPRVAAEMKAMRAFVGAEALEGLAVSASLDAKGVSVRFDFEVDRTKDGLVTTLSNPPAMTAGAASVLPATLEQATFVSVDAPHVYDLLAQAFGPIPQRRPEEETFTSLVASMEKMLGVSLRDELIPALGNEIVLTGSTSFMAPTVSPTMLERKPVSVIVVPVRDPAVVRRAVSGLTMSLAGKELPSTTYKGAEMWAMPGAALALSGEYAIVGPDEDVRKCLDAVESGAVLAKSEEFASEMAAWPGDTIYASFVSKKWVDEQEEAVRKYSEKTNANRPGNGDVLDAAEPNVGFAESMVFGGIGSGYGLMRSMTANPIARDATGVHWEITASLDDVSTLYQRAVKGVLVDSPRAARRAENENEVANALRAIWSAEEQFKHAAGRFGNLDDLVAKGALDKVAADRYRAGLAGYTLKLAAAGTGDQSQYTVTAVPVDYGKSGRFSFYLDGSGVLRGADKNGAAAGADDAVFERFGGDGADVVRGVAEPETTDETLETAPMVEVDTNIPPDGN